VTNNVLLGQKVKTQQQLLNKKTNIKTFAGAIFSVIFLHA